jgi:hypothetical protein
LGIVFFFTLSLTSTGRARVGEGGRAMGHVHLDEDAPWRRQSHAEEEVLVLRRGCRTEKVNIR